MARRFYGLTTIRLIHLFDRCDRYKESNEEDAGRRPHPIAASHADCFAMAPALHLQGAGYIVPTELTAESAVSFDSDGAGLPHYPLSLTLHATVPILV